MKLSIEFGGQKFKADLSDNQKNLRIVLNLVWDMFGDVSSHSIFIPKPKPKVLVDNPKQLKKLKKHIINTGRKCIGEIK